MGRTGKIPVRPILKGKEKTMEFNEMVHATIAARFHVRLTGAFGERGRMAFLHATRCYAEQRGRRMAQRAIRDGVEVLDWGGPTCGTASGRTPVTPSASAVQSKGGAFPLSRLRHPGYLLPLACAVCRAGAYTGGTGLLPGPRQVDRPRLQPRSRLRAEMHPP